MTQEFEEKFVCDNCGEIFTDFILYSTNMFESPDLDTRPGEMKRSTMDTWIHQCPNCKYILQSENELNDNTKSLIKTEEYQTCNGKNFKNDLTEKFYREGLILSQNGKFEDAAISFLEAAWTCDDVDDEKNAIYCRKCFLKNYEKINKKSEDIKLIRIDVLRRVGEFETILNECDPSIFLDDTMRDVAIFGIELAKKKDMGCYSIEDAFKENEKI